MENEKKQVVAEAMKVLMEKMKENFEKNQSAPNQYVVAYYRKKDDSLLGYHLDTFCNVGSDILKAKRYNGENPYPQLAIIAKNVDFTLSGKGDDDDIFGSLTKNIREKSFEGLKSDEVYMDAIYLAEDTPKQSFRYTIINNEENENS